MNQYALQAGLILALPLLSALLLTFIQNQLGRVFTSILGVGSVAISFVLSVSLALQLAGSRGGALTLFPWFSAGSLQVGFTLQLDSLASFMTLVVTGVGSLILLYSVGYMWEDASFARFFVYLDLFIFSMLTLVLAGNFVLLVVGWGLVGLSSYLLIGFWYQRPSAVLAARKAFVMNVIGDVGMVFAVLVIFWNLPGTNGLDYASVFSAAQALPRDGSVILAITLLLLVGAVAKSAQIPLHTWLPDAMEGPTPVSALIHAATMVTAGVYLVARMHPLYEHAPIAAGTVAVIGALTAIFAATIALVQVDIKRVLAYSTMSQIGYMFLAVGVGAYGAGLFHLMTHAFFKALLFLAAGNVIHALHDEQDIRRMGGLGRALPVTRAVFLVGTAAIAGVPLLSGFFSKEAILGAAFGSGPVPPVLWMVGVVTAVLTGFYMFRLYFLTFTGAPRWGRDQHPHEAPMVMLVPVVVLGVLAAVGGYLESAQVFGPHLLSDFLGGQRFPVRTEEVPIYATAVAWSAGLVGIAVAWALYQRRGGSPDRIRNRFQGLASLFERRYYFDDVYQVALVEGTDLAAEAVESGGERGLNRLVAGIRGSFLDTGLLLRPFQSGLIRSYAMVFLAGAVVLTTALLWRGVL